MDNETRELLRPMIQQLVDQSIAKDITIENQKHTIRGQAELLRQYRVKFDSKTALASTLTQTIADKNAIINDLTNSNITLSEMLTIATKYGDQNIRTHVLKLQRGMDNLTNTLRHLQDDIKM